MGKARWVLAPIVVIALLVASFLGYGYYTRHQPTVYAKGGAFGVSESGVGTGHPKAGLHTHSAHQSKHSTTRSRITSGGTHSSTLASDPAPKHASPHHGTTTTSTATPHHTSQPTHSSPKHTSSTPTPGAVITPTSGTYSLAVSGSEQVKFGPISACHNVFPSHATLDVHHATGEPATAYDFDLRLYPGSPNGHDERHIYTYSANAVDLSYEQATVTCSGIKQSTTLDYSPVQTRVELPLKVGASWHNHGGGTSRTETGTSKVVKASHLTVGGRSYQVYEIVTDLTMTGSESGTRHQVWWYSPELAMPLKYVEAETGRRSGASYSDSYTATVASLP